jgi:class I lanthipeptide synthase
VTVASRGLRTAVERALRGEPLREREATRLLAYAVRMATRTTPFGVFASVGGVRFGDRERRVGDAGARTVHANVDHEWLVAAVDAIAERAVASGEDVLVATATALRREGRRFTLFDERKVAADAGTTLYRSVTIAASPAVARALDLATSGRSTAELTAELAERFAVEPDRARALVCKLIDARFLIAAARPSPLDEARERLAALAGSQPWLVPLVDELRTVPAPRRGTPDLAAREAAVERLGALAAPDGAEPVFYDATHDEIVLPDRVRADVLRLADVVIRNGGREHLDAYRARFMTRYESGERLVPLLELIGPQGIGIPARTEFERIAVPPARRARLAALIGAALRAGSFDIDLDEAEWEAIRPPLPSPMPSSLEAAFHVVAPSFDAVSAGDYRIVSSPLVGSGGAAKTAGRFAKYRDAAFFATLRATVAADAPPDAITAEPLFVPQRARSGNVIAHPLLAQTVIPINAFAGGLDAIAPDDLLVGIADDRLALWSRERGRRVHVVWPHAFNPDLAPPLARFFALAARDGGWLPAPLEIGELALLPFVPRIRLGRVILRRATWRLTVAQLREHGLAALAREHGMPRYVTYGAFDNVLAVDTTSDAGNALLRDQTRAQAPDAPIVLVETAIEDDALWLRDADGARYAAEFIVSVRSRPEAPSQPMRSRSLALDEHARTRGPGSPWCYLKLYANEREFRTEIAPRMLEFAEAATADGTASHWFYLFYADPDRHVRLRLRAARDGSALRERAIAFGEELLASGAVSRYALATYERELERYGGAAGTARCEQLFHHDSLDALRAPGAELLEGRERLATLAVPLLGLFDALTTPSERDRWVDTQRFARQPSSREESDVLRELADAPPPDPADERIALGRTIAACGGCDEYLDIVDSVLHMHLNRRSVGAVEETALRRLVRNALLARRSRRAR